MASSGSSDLSWQPWHDHNMNDLACSFAAHLGQLRCENAQCHIYLPEVHGEPLRLRHALRQAGVPVLELNGAPADIAERWIAEAKALSAEYLAPVFIFGDATQAVPPYDSGGEALVTNQDWLDARQVALTRAIESSELNQELRRIREKSGWLHVGWQPEALMAQGNRLMLARSSPLPLKRIRDFSARCPDLVVAGPDVETMGREVAAQGISVARWRFEVK